MVAYYDRCRRIASQAHLLKGAPLLQQRSTCCAAHRSMRKACSVLLLAGFEPSPVSCLCVFLVVCLLACLFLIPFQPNCCLFLLFDFHPLFLYMVAHPRGPTQLLHTPPLADNGSFLCTFCSCEMVRSMITACVVHVASANNQGVKRGNAFQSFRAGGSCKPRVLP